MCQFLVDIMPLMTITVNDVYRLKSSRIPDFNEMTKTDPNVS